MVQIEKRQRFVVLACPYCHEEHDVLLGGGPQPAPCGRKVEALAQGGILRGQVWGLEAEGRAQRLARVIA